MQPTQDGTQHNNRVARGHARAMTNVGISLAGPCGQRQGAGATSTGMLRSGGAREAFSNSRR